MSETIRVSYLAIGPESLLAIGAVLILLLDAIRKPTSRTVAVVTALVVTAAAAVTWLQWDRVAETGPTLHFAGMVALDFFGVIGRMALVVVTGLGLAAAWPLVGQVGRWGAELVALVLLSAAGFMFMAGSAHFFMLFLGLEVGSISLYVLAGMTRERARSDEAALKYFLLGSFASALFVYGIALTYAGTGAMAFGQVRAFLGGTIIFRPAVLLIGVALVVGGLAFKVSAAPFHAWAPDVYQGAPAGVVGFMAAAAKIGGFAGLMRALFEAFPQLQDLWVPALAGLATISLVVGTLLAIMQEDVRRMLAYSGVAHAGFMLTGLVGGGEAAPTVWFYLIAYTVQLVTAFAVVAAVEGGGIRDSSLAGFAGLGRTSPLLAATLATMLVGMSGVPVTSGFVAKFGVFAAAWGTGYEWLVILGLLASVAAFFFYLRVIVVMYFSAPTLAQAPGTPAARAEAVGALQWVLLVGLTITILLGLYPGPLLDLVANGLPL